MYRVFRISFEYKHCYLPHPRCFSTAVKWFCLFQNEISVSTQDFQHITKNCQAQSSLSCVENHAVEIKNHCDGNEMSDRCETTFCMR